MSKITIIETADVQRDYGMPGTEAVIDHADHGRLYLADGYGGETELTGGAVRWRHGRVLRLQPGDTLETLTAAGGWNDGTSILSAALAGYDTSRPSAALSPAHLAALAGL